jgi:hypothetical protein
MQVLIKLPSDPLIHYLKFCRVIADAVSPIDNDLVGIKCVLAKNFPAEKTNEHFGKVPFPLDEADRKALAKLLPNLPPLKYPMSVEQVATFVEAYRNLQERPIWIPVLITEEIIYGRKAKHDQTMDRHLDAIRKECNAGQLVPVDASHVRLDSVQIGAFIPRREAIAYLNRCGLSYEDSMPMSPEQNVSLDMTELQAGDTNPKMLIDRKYPVGAKRFSDAQKEEAVRRSKELEGVVNDFVQQVADEYGVTVKTIDNWRRAARKAKEEAEKLRKFQGYI